MANNRKSQGLSGFGTKRKIKVIKNTANVKVAKSKVYKRNVKLKRGSP
jgi:hypothetical protein